MPTWLEDFSRPQGEQHPLQLAVRLVLAFGLGLLVALVHKRTSAGAESESFHVTLVLLTILIAAVTQVIGDSVARAFSLVGALSIVRFRTVVQDTRDTVFVIFAVTLGMAVGAGNLWIGLVTFCVVAFAAVLISKRETRVAIARDRGVWLLTLRAAPGQGVEVRAAELIASHTQHARLIKAATVRSGAALETTHEIELRESSTALALVDALNQVSGVQSCELSLAPES